MSDQSEPVSLGVIWGVPAIAKAIGRTERAVYHLLEKGQLPGIQKIGGKWCLNPRAFLAATGEPEPSPQPRTNGKGHALVSAHAA
jgi:hypothetical protein